LHYSSHQFSKIQDKKSNSTDGFSPEIITDNIKINNADSSLKHTPVSHLILAGRVSPSLAFDQTGLARPNAPQ
jgi:hypothetical protein